MPDPFAGLFGRSLPWTSYDPFSLSSGRDIVAGGGTTNAPWGTPTATNPSPSFSLNPAPQSGRGPFGSVPGPLGLPNPAGDLAKVYPGLTGATTALSGDILSELQGQLSPSTINAIQDAGASWGVSSGVPGSPLQFNRSLANIGLNSEQLQQSGIANLLRTLPTFDSTMTVSPETQLGVAAMNALYGAAPDPAQAANYAQSLFNRYLGAGGGQRTPGITSIALPPSGSDTPTTHPYIPWDPAEVVGGPLGGGGTDTPNIPPELLQLLLPTGAGGTGSLFQNLGDYGAGFGADDSSYA